MHMQELFFASASWQLRAAFCGVLALEPSKTQELLCSYKLNHKKFFAVGFSNRSATSSFSAVKSINLYIPAETVQRRIQNYSAYFCRVKPREFFSSSILLFRLVTGKIYRLKQHFLPPATA